MKKSTIVLLAALIAINMIGCGREEPVETTAAPTEPPVVEIPFETAPDERPYQGVELNFQTTYGETDPAADVIVQAAEVFEKKTGAKVSVSWQTGAVTEDADIFQLSGTALAADSLTYALDLTELAAAADYENHSFTALRQQVIDRCGYLAGIPQTPYLEGLYYNREIFESCGIAEVPDTWEKFLAVCQKLTGAGYQSLALNSEDGARAVQMHLESFQLTALMEEDALTESEEAVIALQRLIDFANVGFAVHEAYPAGQNKLGLSNGVMTVGTNGTCTEVEDATRMEIQWGVMPWPGGSGYADSDVLAIHNSCANPQAAFDFILLLTTGEFDQLRADVTVGIPADPNNESAIAGAVEMLHSAQPLAAAETSKAFNDLALLLWSGKYKNGEVLAAGLEQLS